MTSRTVDQLYRTLADAMSECLPPDWATGWIEARLLDDFSKVDLYCRTRRGDVSQVELSFDAFGVLDAALTELRLLMKQPDRPAWTTIKVSLDANGKFHADFGYQQA